MIAPTQPDVLTPDQIIHWLKSVFIGVSIVAAVVLVLMNLFIRHKEKATPTSQTKASEVVVSTEATSTPK